MNDLEFAIRMEFEGEQYYRQQAEIYQNTPLQALFVLMAEEEKKHGQILQKKLQNLPYELPAGSLHKDAVSIFAHAGDMSIQGEEIASHTDFYKAIAQKEKKSIALYQEYFEKAEDLREKNILAYLVRQEEQHLAIFEEMVDLLKKAEQWAEDAEQKHRNARENL